MRTPQSSGECHRDGRYWLITVEIETGVVHGDFPKRALRHVLEWLDLHDNELLDNWRLIQARRQSNRIAPLE